ncbi:MAG: sugar phosphate nucleotidyltransferase [Dehalococcoidia bacterium]|nr:sugar phosphate nucleotidyltransferase [Dehalococcoidia bacterium]
MTKVLAMILAGGLGQRLSILAEERAKPAVIYGGKYRIMDFALSNCVNSGITKVGVLTQYRPRSLNDHIGIGRPWDLDRTEGGVFLLQPYMGRQGSDWYKGTADAVYQNLYFVEESIVEHVIVLAGDHIYNMRYDDMVAFHKMKGAEVTLGVTEIIPQDTSRFGMVTLDGEDRVVSFQEKPKEPVGNCISMGIYVFNKETLIECLEADAHRPSSHDFGRDIMPSLVPKGRVYGYRFQGYWRDIGTVEAYWQANMDLLVELPELNLYGPDVVRTPSSEKPPAKVGSRAYISRSLICHGCIINGYVEHSVLSPGAYVEEGAVVRDSILFDDAHVEADAAINRCIVDKEVWIGRGCQVGYGDDNTPNREEPGVLSTGITLVGKRARLPAGLRVGRNCKIDPAVREENFKDMVVPSGETVSGSNVRMRRLI